MQNVSVKAIAHFTLNLASNVTKLKKWPPYAINYRAVNMPLKHPYVEMFATILSVSLLQLTCKAIIHPLTYSQLRSTINIYVVGVERVVIKTIPFSWTHDV